jgi:hypothetical protein
MQRQRAGFVIVIMRAGRTDGVNKAIHQHQKQVAGHEKDTTGGYTNLSQYLRQHTEKRYA